MDEISQEIGIDLQTESMLVRAEQLARLETDKLVDKVKDMVDITSFRWRCHVANVFSFVLCSFVVQIVCLPHAAVFVLRLHDPTEDSARAIVPRASLSQRSKPPARAKRLRDKLHNVPRHPLRKCSFSSCNVLKERKK